MSWKIDEKLSMEQRSNRLRTKIRLHTLRFACCPGASEISYSPVTKTSLWISSLRHFLWFRPRLNIKHSMFTTHILNMSTRKFTKSILSVYTIKLSVSIYYYLAMKPILLSKQSVGPHQLLTWH